ncbi:hypothetical protein HQN64_18865 [Enterobacteriaceae bacterium BIT-l23]|uniref:helix-turn-helix transcriptional regulator n=1 Tax=Jejubacter sp. L23 TaxID=3092086 RepID=UPI001584819A|nr:hypothetical protein [Enterobacteriaceae bacterium BIT-l23]
MKVITKNIYLSHGITEMMREFFPWMTDVVFLDVTTPSLYSAIEPSPDNMLCYITAKPTSQALRFLFNQQVGSGIFISLTQPFDEIIQQIRSGLPQRFRYRMADHLRLTAKEIRVMQQLFLNGQSTAVCAQMTGMDTKAVSRYKRSIMSKLGIQTLSEMCSLTVTLHSLNRIAGMSRNAVPKNQMAMTIKTTE